MAILRTTRCTFAAAFAAWTFAGAAHAQGSAVDEVRRLVDIGRSDEAYPLCAQIDRDAVPQADLWCGVAAVDVGRTGEGVLSIERYVLRTPDDLRGRLELARAYFYAGDDVSARREFESVRAGEPPVPVRAGIDRYLEALSAREAQYRTRVRGYVEAGGGYDSNVNAGVAQADIALPVLGPVTVVDFGVEKRAGFGWLAGSVQVNHPVAPGVAAYGGLVANGQFNASESDFDIAQGAATLGASWQTGRHTFFGTYSHGELSVGGDRYRRSDGVTLEWRHAVSDLATLSVAPQYARIGYPGENAVRDSDFYALGVTLRKAWLTTWQPVLNLSAVGAREENRRDRDDLGRDVYGGSADVTVSPAPQWALNAAFAFQRSTYMGPIPLLGFTRRDDNYSASVGALYFITRELSARVEAQYYRNDSNLALYEYDRYVVAGKLRYDFK
ncbi:hypothetical protein BURK1_00205 [Burkholderiales bacterium]|nr:hypothetical protein BURK1_00205 [Burkholderiales bacterium]